MASLAMQKRKEVNMFTKVSFMDFVDRFRAFDRDENFSWGGKHALFDYLEEYEEETGEPIELDVIALCCDYTEYTDLKELNEAHGKEFQTLEEVYDYTTVIPIEGTERFIIQDY
jgi:hypothetical protein